MVVNISLICDNGYVMPTVVAMVSMIENKAINTSLHFYVLADNLKQENIETIKSLQSDSCCIEIIKVDSSRYSGLEKKHSNVSRTALLKFSIPDILNSIDKVIYIDGDVIVRKDLSELFSLNLGDYYAAVISDGPKQTVAGGKKHAYYGNPLYFNSGVMLLNLRRMREDGITAKLIDFRLKEYNYFMDQDAFNCVLGSNVIHISPKYDMMLHLISFMNEGFSMEQLNDFYKMDCYETVDELLDDAVIYHYTLAKPWKFFDIPGSNAWLKYYLLSPYKNNKLYRASYMTYVLNAKMYRLARKVASVVYVIRQLKK